MIDTVLNSLGPQARVALDSAIRQALTAGYQKSSDPGGARLTQIQDYARNLVETAMILDAAQAERIARDAAHG